MAAYKTFRSLQILPLCFSIYDVFYFWSSFLRERSSLSKTVFGFHSTYLASTYLGGKAYHMGEEAWPSFCRLVWFLPLWRLLWPLEIKLQTGWKTLNRNISMNITHVYLYGSSDVSSLLSETPGGCLAMRSTEKTNIFTSPAVWNQADKHLLSGLVSIQPADTWGEVSVCQSKVVMKVQPGGFVPSAVQHRGLLGPGWSSGFFKWAAAVLTTRWQHLFSGATPTCWGPARTWLVVLGQMGWLDWLYWDCFYSGLVILGQK